MGLLSTTWNATKDALRILSQGAISFPETGVVARRSDGKLSVHFDRMVQMPYGLSSEALIQDGLPEGLKVGDKVSAIPKSEIRGLGGNAVTMAKNIAPA